MADPFERFEEQERSWALLQELGKRLAAKGAERLREDPSVELAELIVETGSPEIRKRLSDPPAEWKALGIDLAEVVQRRVVDTILRGNGGRQVLAWIEEHLPEGFLPIVMVTRNGFRVMGESLRR